MYRLIALDIDDTITLNPRVVPNEIIEAVRKAKEHGIHVTVATGRGWLGSKLIIDQLGITDPVINQYGLAARDRSRDRQALHAHEIHRRSLLRRFEAKTLLYAPYLSG
ncbi:MAG: HAD family hydrolase [Christensenellales bacterium]